MKINFTRNGILEIEDARIIFRNFAGEGTKFNTKGNKNFHVVIPNDEIKEELVNAGYNVKIKQPRTPDESIFMHLQVKIKFNGRGPSIYLESGSSVTKLDEETVDILDEIDIDSVSMDIVPYEWEVNGKTGVTAYLRAMKVIQNVDRFGAKYAEDEMPF